jgi:hypothetical protein
MFYILKIEYRRNSYSRTLFLLSILLSPKKDCHANNTRNPLLYFSIKEQNWGKITVKKYRLYLITFNDRQGGRAAEGITLDNILAFLTDKTEGQKQSTRGKRARCFNNN